MIENIKLYRDIATDELFITFFYNQKQVLLEYSQTYSFIPDIAEGQEFVRFTAKKASVIPDAITEIEILQGKEELKEFDTIAWADEAIEVWHIKLRCLGTKFKRGFITRITRDTRPAAYSRISRIS